MTDEKKTGKEPESGPSEKTQGDAAASRAQNAKAPKAPPAAAKTTAEAPGKSPDKAPDHASGAGKPKPTSGVTAAAKTATTAGKDAAPAGTAQDQAQNQTQDQAQNQTQEASELDLLTHGGADQPPPPTQSSTSRQPPSRSRAMALVALLLALLVGLAGAAGAWWLWQRQQALMATQADFINSQQRNLAEVRDTAVSRVERLAGRVDNLASDYQGQVQQLARIEEAMSQVRGAQEQITNRMQRLADQVPIQQDDWVLSEAGYLFSVADYRVRFRQDIDGALAALEEADRVLARLGPETAEQRQQIRRAVDALVDVRKPDRGALAATLSELIAAVDTWDIVQPETRIRSQPMSGQPDADLTSAEGWRNAASRAWEQLKGSLASLVVIRRDDTPLPLVAPEQAWYLREHIRLELQTARLALLDAEPETYRASLEQAQAWLNRHFRSADPAVQQALETMANLRNARIAPEMPDLSALLPRLNGQQEAGL